MPSFAESLTDEERWQLVDYIACLEPRDEPGYAELVRSPIRRRRARPRRAGAELFAEAPAGALPGRRADHRAGPRLPPVGDRRRRCARSTTGEEIAFLAQLARHARRPGRARTRPTSRCRPRRTPATARPRRRRRGDEGGFWGEEEPAAPRRGARGASGGDFWGERRRGRGGARAARRRVLRRGRDPAPGRSCRPASASRTSSSATPRTRSTSGSSTWRQQRAQRYLGARQRQPHAGRGRGRRRPAADLRPGRVVGDLQAQPALERRRHLRRRRSSCPIAFSVWDGVQPRARQQARLDAVEVPLHRAAGDAVAGLADGCGPRSAVLARRARRSSPGCGAGARQSGRDRSRQRGSSHVQQDLRPRRQLRPLQPRDRQRRRARQGLRRPSWWAATSTPPSMHDYRFKQMEYTLPEEYLDETELERQRKIHDSLITMGLKLISESYLDQMQKLCQRRAASTFEPRMMDGKHHTELVRDIAERRTTTWWCSARSASAACATARSARSASAWRAAAQPRRLGGQAPAEEGRARGRHDPGRHRRQPAVVRRAA